MREKAVLVATEIYEQLMVEYGGEPPKPWTKVRAEMKADNATADLVEFLPKRLDKAVRRNRKERLLRGRPDSRLSGSRGL